MMKLKPYRDQLKQQKIFVLSFSYPLAIGKQASLFVKLVAKMQKFGHWLRIVSNWTLQFVTIL